MAVVDASVFLSAILPRDISLQPVTVQIASRAGTIAADYKIRGCNAVYVALAEALNEDLLTWDKQQRERAKTLVNTYHP